MSVAKAGSRRVRQSLKKALAVVLCCYLSLSAGERTAWAEGPAGLTIAVLKGADAVHVLKGNRVAPVIVEARDSGGMPISGVTVQFHLPASGSGGLFADGQREFVTVTDRKGQARLGRLKLKGEGLFRIEVTASYRGQTAEASLEQKTFAIKKAAEAAEARFGGSSGKAAKALRASNTSGSGVGKKILKGVVGVAIVGGIVSLFVIAARRSPVGPPNVPWEPEPRCYDETGNHYPNCDYIPQW